MKDKPLRNIVLIATTDFPFNTSSANLLRNLALGLVKNNKNVHLLINQSTIYGKQEGFSKRTNTFENIKFTFCSFIKRPSNYLLKIIDIFFGATIIPFILIWKKIKGNVDVVIIYTGYFYQNFPTLLVCKLFSIPIYKYSVDWYNKKDIAKNWWMLPKWWMFYFEIEFSDRFLSGIISISSTLDQHYSKLGLSCNKRLLIPNFIDLMSFYKAEESIYSNDIIRIGYCGAAPLLNGVDDLIKAIKILDSRYDKLELLIVGDVANETISQLPFLKKLALELGINEKIVFTGRVESSKVPDYLKSCDILVLARKNTTFAQAGFPTKLGEYMAAKKPIVMTNVGDITTYFNNKKELVIVESENPKSIAVGISFLINNKLEANNIAENGYQWAKNNLDYRENAKKLIKFISKE